MGETNRGLYVELGGSVSSHQVSRLCSGGGRMVFDGKDRGEDGLVIEG